MDYVKVFRDIEATLIAEGSRRMSREDVLRALEPRRTAGIKRLSDADYFEWLVLVVFYSGFRAETVGNKKAVILEHFPDYQNVANYRDADIRRIVTDPKMIRHEGKIRACVKNARKFGEIVAKSRSFQEWLDSYKAFDGGPALDRLVADLRRFAFFGPKVANHFLTHLGYPTLKPDIVVRRILFRLGLLDREDDDTGAIEVGRRIARENGVPIPYVDYILVCYGQVSHHSVGIERGICLDRPRCEACGVTWACRYFASNRVATK